MVWGVYFDGKAAQAQRVKIKYSPEGKLTVYAQDGQKILSAPLAHIEISERFQHAPRSLTFKDGNCCEFDDHEALDMLLEEAGYRQSFANRLLTWKNVLLSLTLVIMALIGVYRIGLPWAAQQIAYRIPASVEVSLGKNTLNQIDVEDLSPTELPADSQAKLREKFHQLLPDTSKYHYQLLFRKGNDIGPNAFALPGGYIIVTDELVELVESVENGEIGLLGIFAHEMGHVEFQHGLRQTIQSSAGTVLLSLALGDISYLFVAVPATIMTLQYSRDMEREADQYALDVLKNKSLPLRPYGDLLLALEETVETLPSTYRVGQELFSTHPLTEERIELIEAAAKENH